MKKKYRKRKIENDKAIQNRTILSIALLFYPPTFKFRNSNQIYFTEVGFFYSTVFMTLIIFYVKFNFRQNSTYKSTLKALKRQNFGLKAGLLSTAKWVKQRARRERRCGSTTRLARQTKTNSNATHCILGGLATYSETSTAIVRLSSG